MEQLQSFLPLMLIIVVMYLFMIRPQQKRVKKEKEFESTLKVGDKIITKGGLHGRVHELNEKTVIIETLAGKLQYERSAISMEMSAALKAPEAK